MIRPIRCWPTRTTQPHQFRMFTVRFMPIKRRPYLRPPHQRLLHDAAVQHPATPRLFAVSLLSAGRQLKRRFDPRASLEQRLELLPVQRRIIRRSHSPPLLPRQHRHRVHPLLFLVLSPSETDEQKVHPRRSHSDLHHRSMRLISTPDHLGFPRCADVINFTVVFRNKPFPVVEQCLRHESAASAQIRSGKSKHEAR